MTTLRRSALDVRARSILVFLGLLPALALLSACGSTQEAAPTTAASTQQAATAPASTQQSAPTATASLEDQYVAVVQHVGPSVVLIQTSEGLGSGVVFDDKGNIVTNAHVIGASTTFRVTLADGKTYDGTLVGTFAPDDLGVIHVDASGVTPADFGDSSKLQVGDIALAIGNPLGLQSSVTDGIVSALGRTVSEQNGVTLPNVIQTSAPINPGNSGGALANLAGQVIGIPTLGAVDQQLGGTAPGIGFAIPSNVVTDIAGQLVKNGRVISSHRAYLGVGIASTTSGGVLVNSVEPGGPAARAGIAEGDVITSVDGKPTPSPDELASVLATLEPGKAVEVAIVHPDGTQAKVQVTLGEYPG